MRFLLGPVLGAVVSFCLLLMGTMQTKEMMERNPTLLFFGILMTGAWVTLPKSSNFTRWSMIVAIVPAAIIAMRAERCPFYTGQSCVALYTTQQSLTYSASYLAVGIALGLAIRASRALISIR